MLAFSEGCADLAEAFRELDHLLAAEVRLAPEHQHFALEPQVAQEGHHLGVVEVLGEVDAVHDRPDARLHGLELEVDAAYVDGFVVNRTEMTRHEFVLGADVVHHRATAGYARGADLGDRPDRCRPGRWLVGVGAFGAADVEGVVGELRILGFEHCAVSLAFGLVDEMVEKDSTSEYTPVSTGVGCRSRLRFAHA